MQEIPVSPTEYKVATALYRYGYSDKQLAKHLNMSRGTVGIHLHRIRYKVKVKTDRELIAWMNQNTIFPIDGRLKDARRSNTN
jgi:DNA-binding CsgD family transcriptional regulator